MELGTAWSPLPYQRAPFVRRKPGTHRERHSQILKRFLSILTPSEKCLPNKHRIHLSRTPEATSFLFVCFHFRFTQDRAAFLCNLVSGKVETLGLLTSQASLFDHPNDTRGCLLVCTHTHMYPYIHVHLQTHEHTHTRTHIHTCTCKHMNTHTYFWWRSKLQ